MSKLYIIDWSSLTLICFFYKLTSKCGYTDLAMSLFMDFL
jgi:hypothetical protein